MTLMMSKVLIPTASCSAPVISGLPTVRIRSSGPPKAQAIVTSPRTSATAASAPFICTISTLEASTPR